MAAINYTPANKKWTKENIIKAIQASSVDGYCKANDIPGSVSVTARNLFGSLREALKASGLKLWSERPKHTHCTVDGCDSVVRSGRSEYCERHYYRLRRTGNVYTTEGNNYINPTGKCIYCLKPTSLHSKYCSSACNIRDYRGSQLVKKCLHCGNDFDPLVYGKGANRTCCSDECRRLATRTNKKKLRQDNIEKYSELSRIAEYKRKSLKRAVAYEHIDRDTVFARDNYICQLCSKPIDRNAKWPDSLFATLDHIVPLSKGGSHTYSNVQTAHLKCNCIKGNRV